MKADPATPTVAVIIPARNDGADLTAAVEAVLHQQSTEVAEVVICVGPSDDDTALVANALSVADERVRVVENPSGRTPDALNRSIAATTSEVVARVDARAVIPPYYLRDALETMQNSGAANVGAVQRPVGRSPVQQAIAAAMRSRLGSGGASYRHGDMAKPVDTAWLGVFDRDALDHVGCYDERFVRNQDAELNARLRAEGYEVWLDPRLTVEYLPRQSLAALASQYRQYGWWRYLTARRHGELRLRQIAPPLSVVGLCGAILIALFWPPALLASMAYVVMNLAAGLSTRGLSGSQRFLVVAALVVMQLSWGAGFLASVATHVVRPSALTNAYRSSSVSHTSGPRQKSI